MPAYNRDSGYPQYPDGNMRVDFVWGNMPLQPNEDRTWELFPGDGESEYFLKGHLPGDNPWFLSKYYYNVPENGFPSSHLTGGGFHDIALREWSFYPEFAPNTGYYKTVNWWTEGQPGAYMPGVANHTLAEALSYLRTVGIAEELLVDVLTDAENPYDYGNITQPGVVIWRYCTPDQIIGYHWDGSPWYAREAEGLVQYASTYAGNDISVLFDPMTADYPYWLSFSVIQTTDPNKNSYNWWD